MKFVMASKDCLGQVKGPFLYGATVLVSLGIIAFYWPGYLSDDSKVILQNALSGHYDDANAPLMAMYWSLWVGWRQGPEPILLTHQGLLFLSTCLLLTNFKEKKIAWGIPFIPLIPNIFCYSGASWKDVGFALTYLLAAMILTTFNLKKRSVPKGIFGIVWILLFYGTEVKYQGQFVLPLFCLWGAWSLCDLHRGVKKKLLTALALWISFQGGSFVFRESFTQEILKRHYWQYVKLYDLAGISVAQGQDFIPDFNKVFPAYSYEALCQTYSHEKVDSLVPLLKFGANQEERDILWERWFQTVKTYPLSYIFHRSMLWKNMVWGSPIKPLNILKTPEDLPKKVRMLLKIVPPEILLGIREMTRFGYVLPLVILYLLLGLWDLRRGGVYGLPLSCMMGASITLMAFLFVFSMASDLRYIYLSMTLFHFSHPLAWSILKSFVQHYKKQQRKNHGSLGL